MALLGAGTKSSPIAIDDSEDEVIYELSKDTSSRSSPTGDIPDSYQKHATPDRAFDDLNRHYEIAQPIPRERKRKRAGSFASQDIPVAGPSRPKQRNHPSLVNRLSQPESKKARKRRRKAERQAQEEARLQNIHYNWLNKTGPFAENLPPAPPHASWSHEHQVYSDPSYVLRPPSLGVSLPVTDGIFPRSYLSYNSSNPYQEETNFYDNYDSHSVTPPSNSLPPTPTLSLPSTTSDWVSAMAMAAESSTNLKNIDSQTSHWSPMPTQISLPPLQPPPLPPPPPPSHSQSIAVAPKPTTGLPKPVEHHALPPKPPPPQPVSSIGMQPDQDPNSKHGIFHITTAVKDVGTDSKKKKNDQYIPNPARTLVMEQLPKSHRQPEFINKWSRTACSFAPVHLFIDGPRGKALIEFATAELARKAWSSPKLGAAYAHLKPHQLKGKPREDLIKVWWYRVDGVGAGAGVGEIEEGEIEGDAGEKEPEVVSPKKETKKERKARLAKEREEKRLAREAAELKAAQERQAQQPPLPPASAPMIFDEPASVAPRPVSPMTSSSAPRLPVAFNSQVPQFQAGPPSSAHYSGSIPPYYPAWIQSHGNPAPPSNLPVNKTAFGASVYLRSQRDDNESIASSAASGERANTMEAGQVDELEDFEEVDMDVDLDDVVLPPPRRQPLAPPLIHNSLPPRPSSPPRTSRPSLQKPHPKTQPQFSASATPFIPRNPAQNAPPPPRHSLPLPQPPFTNTTTKPQHTHAPVLQQPRPQNPTTIPTASSSVSLSLPSASTVPSPSVSASSTTPVPSEPKAMKNAPTEPSFTKRALMARQKELEEKFVQSKLELAAATSTHKPDAMAAVAQASQPPPLDPSVDQEGKQAREDRLRKLVMQSQRAKAKPVPRIASASDPPGAVIPSTPSNPPAPLTHHEEKKTTTATSSSSTISASSHSGHDFSLEDLAVSFITQTIETMKSKPSSVKTTPSPVSSASVPAPAIKPSPSYSHVKSDLAAKQKRLEEHISETKNLMARLSQCRSKEEKEVIMKIMREKTRLFEAEENKAASSSTFTLTSSTPMPSSFTTTKFNTASGSVVNKAQTTATSQQINITRWPVSQQDSGVLLISDDEDEDENEDDDDDGS